MSIVRDNLYKEAIYCWGVNNQLDMVVEECAELIQAINKMKRKSCKETQEALCGEIADVEIMLGQLRLIIQRDELIDTIKKQKHMRLWDRIEKHKKND